MEAEFINIVNDQPTRYILILLLQFVFYTYPFQMLVFLF